MVLQHYVVISELLLFFFIVDIKNINMTQKMSDNLNI